MRIITEWLQTHPAAKRWAWFAAIYGGSVVAFGAVVGVLEMCVPK
ncbi:MAG TPA: hypothetical protein PLT25_12625 [Acidocella sp.]|nr:hypothetical protein [Acidocella sp.]HQU05546.1 hypothetical protein [Acidocella sp.]